MFIPSRIWSTVKVATGVPRLWAAGLLGAAWAAAEEFRLIMAVSALTIKASQDLQLAVEGPGGLD
jgi:hypothetical protein